MRHEKCFRMTCTSKRIDVLRNKVGCEPGNFPTDARPLARENRNLFVRYILLGVYLACRAKTSYALYCQGKVRCIRKIHIGLRP